CLSELECPDSKYNGQGDPFSQAHRHIFTFFARFKHLGIHLINRASKREPLLFHHFTSSNMRFNSIALKSELNRRSIFFRPAAETLLANNGSLARYLIASANASGSCGATRYPSTPWSMSSGTPPRFVAMTGVS